LTPAGAPSRKNRQALILRCLSLSTRRGSQRQPSLRVIASYVMRIFEQNSTSETRTSQIPRNSMPSACPRTRHRMVVRDKVLELGSKTLIMGVLNVTPDSFSDGALFLDPAQATARAWQIAEEGADILDIGGESTRPGSSGVTAEEEMRRVLPVIDALAGSYPLPISLDTSKPAVARAGLAKGVALVNDVTSLRHTPEIDAYLQQRREQMDANPPSNEKRARKPNEP